MRGLLMAFIAFQAPGQRAGREDARMLTKTTTKTV